ncbi:GPP34 family phosphoprotein [Actinoplanes sp. TFC3]|uniref:GPP34 family phosphoprotein n=1 Tax=Actinoplanes sp. TFC3 TaxID=1710355 RepID=UPI00083074FC|nr:GPP34 family phosphoprotein [Actinoplanes sp. TFC3]
MSRAEIGTLRERLWLLAHDDRTDLQLLLPVGSLSIGLMAATLTDLLLTERITLDEGYLYPTRAGNRQTPADLDPVTAGVLHAITIDQPRLAELLRAASADLAAGEHHPYVRLYQRTQAALVAAGLVVEHRRTLRPSRYRLADPSALSWNKGQLNHRLVYHYRTGDPAIDSLCALVAALNLQAVLVTPYSSTEAAQVLRQIVHDLGEHAPTGSPLTAVPQLVTAVREAVGDLATAIF